jgi:hypothetical protein
LARLDEPMTVFPGFLLGMKHLGHFPIPSTFHATNAFVDLQNPGYLSALLRSGL